jgi:hypothetical protein
VVSSASRWRPLVVPAVPAHRAQCSQGAHAAAQEAKRSNIEVTGAAACLDGGAAPGPGRTRKPAADRRSRGCVQAATRYIPWCELLKRVYDLDASLCPRCGARLRMIALIMDQDVARQILKSLGLPSKAPVIARARAPTLFEDPPPDYDAA